MAETNECKDLGVITTSNLSSHSYCSQIVRNAAWRIKQLKLVFDCHDANFMKFLYVTYIRPILEYNTQIWSPNLIGDINLVENVQRKLTKCLPGFNTMSYLERLNVLNLDTLEVRRIIFDLTLMFKIVHRLIDIDPNQLFTFNSNTTRGHCYKINVQYSRINARKYFFINRIIPIWNALDPQIVISNSLYTFKKEINKVDFSSYCKGSIYGRL